MQSSSQYDELVELKTELATVVEVLDILHDFIDSVFGAKFQSFCGNKFQCHSNVTRGSTSGGSSSPLEALRDLRWKHFGNNARGSDILRRSSSSSSSTSQIFTHSSGSGGNTDENNVANQKQVSTSPFPSMEGPDISDVNVKLEITHDEEDDVTDYLEDVDPFYGLDTGEGGGSYSSSYNYGHENEMKYAPPAYQTSETPVTNAPSNISCPKPISIDHSARRSSSNSTRCIPPGLIPIGSDPLQETSLEAPQKIDDTERSSSSGSDTDWHPSSTSKKSKPEGKKKRKATVKKLKRDPFDQPLPGAFTPPKPPSTQLNPMKFSLQKSKASEIFEGGPFKCSMCPASYKQEDSLRSHQKYKHNPSRVQCVCNLCGKSMVDKYRLQRHLRLHTGEKPFECNFCGQSFYRKDYHTKHLQRKHGIGVSNSSSPSNPVTPPITIGKSPKRPGPLKPSPPPPTATSGDLPNTASQQTINSPTFALPEDQNFIDYFSSPPASSSNSLAGNMITMTSLTFDDLISADL